jgi:hypothetical protein
MTTTESLPQPAAAAASSPRAVPQRRWYQGAALALIALGGLLLAGNLGLLSPDARQVVDIAWAVALLAAGVLLAVTRGRPALLPLQSFALDRSEAARAALTATMGAADLQLRVVAGADHLAVGDYGGPAEPQLDVRDGVAAVKLDARRGWPLQAGACWPVALAKECPWELQLESGLGDFDLDLGDLEISALRLRSTLGRVNLALPAAGAANLDVDLTFGDLTVSVPDGMAVRLKLAAGPLSEFEHDERRFVRVGPDEWVTPLYAVATNRCTLAVRLWAGDFTLL